MESVDSTGSLQISAGRLRRVGFEWVITSLFLDRTFRALDSLTSMAFLRQEDLPSRPIAKALEANTTVLTTHFLFGFSLE